MGSIFTVVFPLTSFILSCIALLIFCFTLLQYVVDRDRSYLRFLLLISLFIFYNISNGIFPNWDYIFFIDVYWSVLSQNITAYTAGIVLAIYYFYYLTVEFDIKLGKLFNIKFLLISLFAAFWLGYCLTFVLTHDKDLARQIFIPFPSMIALYFAFNTARFIIKNRKENKSSYQKAISFLGYAGIIFISAMPLMLLWGDQYKGVNHLVVNVALYLAFFSNILQFIHHNRRFNPNSKASDFDPKYLDLKKKLTKREIEVVTCVGQLKSNKEIGELMFISVSTVRKHLSNIYDKAGVSNIEEFKANYPDVDQLFYE